MKKVKVIYSASFDSYCYPFQGMGDKVVVVDNPADMKETDAILILWGGADIEPSYYGHLRQNQS